MSVLSIGLVQVEVVHGGVAVQQGEQRPLRDSGHPVGICAGALDAVAACEPIPRGMHSTCTVRLPADAGELVQASARRHPARRVARQVKPGRFAQNDTAPALRRIVCHVPADRRLHARAGVHHHARINAVCRRRRACCARASRDRTDGPRDRCRVTGRGDGPQEATPGRLGVHGPR